MTPEALNEIQEAALNLAKEKKYKEAIQHLLENVPSTNPYYNELILLDGRWNFLIRDQNLGLIASEHYTVTSNRITYSLIHLIKNLDKPKESEKIIVKQKVPATKATFSNTSITLLLALILTVLLYIAFKIS